MEPKDLLQVNATVIAGLLILLTIQTSSDEIRPLQDHNEWENNITKLEVEKYALEKTLETLYNKTSSITSEERTKQLQMKADEVSTRLVEVSHTLDKMKKHQIKIIDKNGKIITVEEEASKLTFTKIIQMYGITMLVPFIASSLILMAIFLENPEKKNKIHKAFGTAKWLTLLGFAAILVSLVVFNYFIQLG